MRIETNGRARIRHKDTNEIFDIEADELEWDSVGGSERQMGPETEHTAEVHHPGLGEIVWKLWEYPIGAENYQDQELNGHELIENFDISLVHEPDGEDEPVEDDRDNLADVPSDEMKEWFYGSYEDPAQSLPYNSREGGYQWIRGGPYTALEALEEEYGDRYQFEILEKVAAEIEDESGGLTEWSPVGDIDEFDREESEFDVPTPEERRAAAERVRRSADELEALLAPLIEIQREKQAIQDDGLPGIGHNGPPDPIDGIGIPSNLFEELRATTSQIAVAVDQTQQVIDRAEASEPVPALPSVPGDPDRALVRALAEHTDALRDNTSTIRENSELLKKKTSFLTPKNVAIGGVVGVVGGKLLDGALTKLGEMLLERGLSLVGPLGPAASGYLAQISMKLYEFADLAMEYINMLPTLF
ncbi:hypothetical protein [Sinorhizobium meliloti]|uniref:hypothetical protein n=1 Tax=Rhizobium meliloti TaxID=382 RepID=UPI000FE0CE8C|nr:hypothetical protein [Sinorhizobium meliloti]RVL94732.1 hypothetical protein CN136_21695 [Sinorhizobium meliloti]